MEKINKKTGYVLAILSIVLGLFVFAVGINALCL